MSLTYPCTWLPPRRQYRRAIGETDGVISYLTVPLVQQHCSDISK